MKTIFFIFFIGILQISTGQNKPIPTDRWLELDIYWFEKNNMEESAEKLLDRYHPLLQNLDGWKGFIINTGWLIDNIVGWNGDINQLVGFPDQMKTPPWFNDKGVLTGTAEELWDNYNLRLKRSSEEQVLVYEDWTYSDVKNLINLLKEVAETKYNIPDLKVGTYVLGWDNAYEGALAKFAIKHPYLFMPSIYYEVNVLDIEGIIKAGDNQKYGAYPNGIPNGTAVTEFFGKQWGSLSKAVGYDAIILRDAMFGPGTYKRVGPYGATAPSDPKKVESWNRATADLVKFTKQSNPDALVIGYSNGATSVGDWRVNCVDLETIAKEGYMDAYIDQSWAGAWNEVGVRHRAMEYQNNSFQGWTYQLAYILLHRAMLAETNVHHYVLNDMWDGWETWDIIHTVPERVKWGIWAYTHAALKTPDGLKVPDGNYISWCNQGKKLLSKEDVKFLAKEFNSAVLDAQNMKEVHGPTLVYNRSAMEWMSANAPEKSILEWIDEQAGAVMKWSVPIMSVTRLEYLDDVKSDMFILQTPVHMAKKEKESVKKLINSGDPVAIWGSIAGGVDTDILEMLGVHSTAEWINDTSCIATLNHKTGGIFEDIPNTFPVYNLNNNQKFTVDDNVEVMYQIHKTPTLMWAKNRKVILWNPAEHAQNLIKGGFYEYLGYANDEILGSVYPWYLNAKMIHEMMKDSGHPYAKKTIPLKPVSILSWTSKDGKDMLLSGELEEGLNHYADHNASVTWCIPKDWLKGKVSYFSPEGTTRGYFNTTGEYDINLDHSEVNFYDIRIK